MLLFLNTVNISTYIEYTVPVNKMKQLMIFSFGVIFIYSFLLKVVHNNCDSIAFMFNRGRCSSTIFHQDLYSASSFKAPLHC